MAQDYYLMHYGVKGMKWGVRRTPEQLGHKVKQKKIKADAMVSAGYDSKGNRSYSTAKQTDIDREVERRAKIYAESMMKHAFGENWKSIRDSQEIYESALVDAFEDAEQEVKRELAVNNYIKNKKVQHGIVTGGAELYHHGIKGMKWGVRRTPEQLGHRTLGQKAKTKLSDPEFKRKAAKAAKIALAVGAIYAGHKVINDPRVLKAGKDLATSVLANAGKIKASAVASAINTTEFKAISKIGKPTIDAAKKAIKVVSSDKFRKTVTGIGAVAGTAGVLRKQVKEFKKDLPDDKFDRTVEYAKRGSRIGESVNDLARASGSNSSSSTSGSVKTAFSEQKRHEIISKVGAPSNKGIDKSSKEYQSLFKDQSAANRDFIKKMAANGFDSDQIRKYLNEFDSQFDHSSITYDSAGRIRSYTGKIQLNHAAIPMGWRFNASAGCRYIF